MYPISKEALDLFVKGYRQTADITFSGTEQNLKLTEADIIQGGLSVNRCSVSGNRIEIGSAIASELALILNNRDDRFSSIVFEGAELFVRVGIKKWDAHRWENAQMHYIPLGYFTVDESPRKLARITLTALDRMVHFDKTVDWSLLVFPTTAGQLLEKICSICNVTLGMNASELLNHDYIIQNAPDREDITYRQILSWIAEITCTCAFIDWRGQLMLKWYEKTNISITPSDRYTSDLYEREITITGAAVSSDDEIYLAGSDDYALNIEDNPLIQHDHAALAASLYEKLGGFSYTPFSAEVKHYPQFYPLDMISFIDKNGVAHDTIVTDATFTLNANTAIEGKGETVTKSGYAAQNPLTNREQSVLEKLKREQNKQLAKREQALLGLNETIWNSLGLRITEVEDDSGGVIRYFHDGQTLESSTIIYTMRAGGFAWTDEWNGEDTVWQYGFTRDGNAVLNILTAYKIQAEQIEAGSVTAEKLSVEYRSSVEDDINAAMNEAEQAFEVGLGIFRSEITSEITEEKNRAQQAEQLLSDGLEVLSGDIDTVETTLSSKIEQTAESIQLSVSLETTRAQQAEDELRGDISSQSEQIESLSSELEIAAGKIEAKVSRGDVCAAIKLETSEDGADVEIRGNHLIVESDNFQLSQSGEVSASGSFTSRERLLQTTVSGGSVNLSYAGLSALQIVGGGAYGCPMFVAHNSNSVRFVVGQENGRIITFGSAGAIGCGNLSTDGIVCDGSIIARGYNPQGWLMSIPMYYSDGTLRIGGNVMVDGALMCASSELKYKVVETEHFGHRGVAAMESALPVFADMGTAVCDESGVGFVDIGPVFAETIDTEYSYHVFLTQIGSKKIDYVAEKTPTHFIVKGEAGARFDWILYAPQKGHSGSRLQEVDMPPKKETVDFDTSVFDGANLPSAVCDEYAKQFIAEAERLSVK